MESEQFDRFTRALGSRRSVLAGLAGSLASLLGFTDAHVVRAHNPVRTCRGIADPGKRSRCLRRARAHNRKRHTCRPQPVSVTCANRCGRTTNNCKKAVACACPAGKLCLINDSCSRLCDGEVIPCPANCECGVPAVEGGTHCFPAAIQKCEQVPQVCTSTSQCPIGHFCGIADCGPAGALEGRCIPVCSV